MKQFYQALVNTLISNVTTSFLWFALIFWTYLETKSVLATGVIGGVLGLILGVVVLVNPVVTGLVFVWALGLYAVLYGALNIALAFRVRA